MIPPEKPEEAEVGYNNKMVLFPSPFGDCRNEKSAVIPAEAGIQVLEIVVVSN
jgi:hypothetical protein